MSDATLARDTALAAVEAAAPYDWMAAARDTIRALARTGTPFTSDQVWARLAPPPEPRALGAVMRGMARDRVIVATGEYWQSKRIENHARPCAVWIGEPAYVEAHRPAPSTLF